MPDALFDVDPVAAPVDELAGKSAQQRLTIRQRRALDNGQHPLSLVLGHMPLHDEAAPAGTRVAEGRRCRNCVFHSENAWGYPQCDFGDGARRSHGAATDCRGWWPGCRDHQYESEAAR